jgi:hypothetical protein
MKDTSPAVQLKGFMAKYTPAIAATAQAVLAKLRTRLPTAFVLVYDNYNALAIGFSPTERAADVIISIALYPRWVSLFFLQAAGLPDPQGLLKGQGKAARHIVLASAADLDKPAIKELLTQALKRAAKPLAATGDGQIVIKSVSAKQRPRRPKVSAKPGAANRGA